MENYTLDVWSRAKYDTFHYTSNVDGASDFIRDEVQINVDLKFYFMNSKNYPV